MSVKLLKYNFKLFADRPKKVEPIEKLLQLLATGPIAIVGGVAQTQTFVERRPLDAYRRRRRPLAPQFEAHQP